MKYCSDVSAHISTSLERFKTADFVADEGLPEVLMCCAMVFQI